MIRHEYLEFSTRGDTDIIDITSDIENIIDDSDVQSGLINIFAPGSTAGITTLEFERGLIKDTKTLLSEIAPQDRSWSHNLTWGDGNGHSHLRSSLIGPSLTAPIVDGRLIRGTWQQIVFIDFDNRPRDRKIIITLLGEE